MEAGGSTSGDVEALLALFRATGGHDWKNPWDIEADVNKWHGVEWNRDGRVIKLDLRGNNLQGARPPP